MALLDVLNTKKSLRIQIDIIATNDGYFTGRAIIIFERS